MAFISNNLLTIRKAVAAGGVISLAGGICISVGGGIFGAVIFSVGLMAVVAMEMALFTGRVGYVTSKDICNLLLIWLINVLTAVLIGFLYSVCALGNDGVIYDLSARTSVWYVEFGQAIACGALMYIAVEGYRRTKSLLIVIFAVTAFVASGAEHCIADAFFLGAGRGFSFEYLLWLIVISCGNALGSILLHRLSRSKE